MLLQMKHKKNGHAAFTSSKNHFFVTGYLCSPVTKGKPVEYVYHGDVIQTSAVVQILSASEESITFETLNYIYTISYNRVPSEGYALSA